MECKLFICHASEDKPMLVEPLVEKLREHGVSIWYDNLSIEFGDNIAKTIEQGLESSSYGIVVLSQSFFQKDWPQRELNVLLQKERHGRTVVLPLLHGIQPDELKSIMPDLSEKAFIQTEIQSGQVLNFDFIVKKIIRVLLNSSSNGLHDMSLIEVLEKCKTSYNKTFQIIGDFLDKFYNIINTDIDMAVIRAEIIVEYLLEEVLKRNSFDISGIASRNVIDHCSKQKLLGLNIDTHCRIISNFAQIARRNGHRLELISKEDLNACTHSLRAILNWYMNTYNKSQIYYKNELQIIWPEDFTEDVIKESYIIETKLFDPALISPVEIALQWADHNPQINIGVRDKVTGRLAGFFCTLPITDTLFAQIASGNYIDTHLPIDEIRQYDPPDFYKLYLCSFCIDPDYQNTKAFKLLSNAFIDLLLRFADQEIYISEMIADAITDKGERLCKHIAMKVINVSTHGSKIYKTTLLPPSLRIISENAARLEKFYSELYNRYKDIL